MKENNSIVRLFRSRKGFLLGNFLFCSMYSIGYALAVHSKELVDSLSILLMSFSLVLVAGMVLLFLLHSWNLAKQTYEHSRQWNREFISGEKLNELKENIEKSWHV